MTRLSLLFLTACAGTASDKGAGQVVDSGTGATTESDADTDSDTDADSDADTDSDTDADTDTDTDTDTTPPAPQVVRFVAMGDGGEGNADQYAVAAVIADVCAAKTDDHPGCDFVLYMGDNFYDDGVSSASDEQFQTKFELPYADVDLPFYVVLGNHDYGYLSLAEWKESYEVDYTTTSDKWTLPDDYYSFTAEHAQFYGLNTTALMLSSIWGDSGQDSWIESELSASTADWQIAFGHHPYLSNGQHGNAGSYEGYDWLPIANGEAVQAFMEDHLCGNIDLYLCGHDHTLQWLEPSCGMELVVSGAAAKNTALVGRDVPTYYEEDTEPGFIWVELSDDTLTGEMWTESGSMTYTRTMTRTP